MLNHATTTFLSVSHRHETNDQLCDDIGVMTERQQTENQDEDFLITLWEIFKRKEQTKKIQDFALHSDHIWGVSKIDSLLTL